MVLMLVSEQVEIAAPTVEKAPSRLDWLGSDG
jgi:hypothetical protein